jgi:hypothetical protein
MVHDRQVRHRWLLELHRLRPRPVWGNCRSHHRCLHRAVHRGPVRRHPCPNHRSLFRCVCGGVRLSRWQHQRHRRPLSCGHVRPVSRRCVHSVRGGSLREHTRDCLVLVHRAVCPWVHLPSRVHQRHSSPVSRGQVLPGRRGHMSRLPTGFLWGLCCHGQRLLHGSVPTWAVRRDHGPGDCGVYGTVHRGLCLSNEQYQRHRHPVSRGEVRANGVGPVSGLCPRPVRRHVGSANRCLHGAV